MIKKIKELVRKYSSKHSGKELNIDLDDLVTITGRKKLQRHLREANLSHLEITKHLSNLESDEILRRNLMVVKKRIVRCYLISGFDFASRDNDSPSDPFVTLECNDTKYSERDNY